MKQLRNPGTAPYLCAALGLVGMVLRLGLYLTGLDEKNLLRSGHPLEIGLWVLTAAAAVYVLLHILGCGGSGKYEENFDSSLAAAVGHVLAAGGIVSAVLWNNAVMPGALGAAWKVLGYLAGVGLAAAAFFRLLGRRPFFLTHTAACLFFAVHIVNHYRMWSGDPQLQDYVFSLLAVMALMFFSYYNAVFDTGEGNRRLHRGTGMASVYLCLVALSGSGYPLLYLGGALWALTDLCTLKSIPAEREESDSHDPA